MPHCFRLKRFFAVLLFVALATPAFAIAPQWMPGFPMRMGTNVMLMWTPVPGASAYNIYKAPKEGEKGALLASPPMNNHMDMNVAMDQSAYYTIKAVVAGAESAEASTPGAVVGVKPIEATKWIGHMEGEGNVTLRFDSVTGASFYNVYRSETEAGPFSLMGSVQETRYVDANIKEGKSYYYQATAVDKNNLESPRSPTYAYKFEKKVAVVAAKVYKQVDTLVTLGDDIWGSDERPLAQPTWLSFDGTNVIVGDLKGILLLGQDGQIVKDMKPIPNYEGGWGTLRGIGVSREGMVLATYMKPSKARALNADGAVALEFEIIQPTREEYVALGREKDWEEDKSFLVAPTGIVEDKRGNYWVAEGVFGQIHIYDRQGKLLKKIGEPRSRKAEESAMKSLSLLTFHEPTNRVYAVDAILKLIRAFDANTQDWIKGEDGKPFYGWNRGGAATGFIQEVRGIDVMSDGNIIMTDGYDGRIQIFTPSMDYMSTLVDAPAAKRVESIGAPMGIVAVDKKVYVAEPLDQKLSVLNLP